MKYLLLIRKKKKNNLKTFDLNAKETKVVQKRIDDNYKYNRDKNGEIKKISAVKPVCPKDYKKLY